MPRLALLAVALLLAACSNSRSSGQKGQAAPEAPPPRVFAQEYVASPGAHFETLAEQQRQQQAAAKAAAKEAARAKEPGTKGTAAAPASGFPPPSATR